MKNILIACVFYVSVFSGCSSLYVIKQGTYQLELILGSEKIEKALRLPHLDQKYRKKLMLIQEVREFSQRKLNLKADKNYKTINLEWDKKIYNISASDKVAFKAYTWWFPIIGAVPYKGFFDEKDALKELKQLKELELDTMKRGVSGYSTLGYFEDPVWPSMLRMDDASLVELIIHELAHATIYFPEQTPFNESFANFVGKMGAQLFFAHKYGSESTKFKQVKKSQLQNKIFTNFFNKLYDALNEIYSSDESFDTKVLQKKLQLQQAEKKYKILAKNEGLPSLDWEQVNNAFLLSYKRYNFDEDVFVQLFHQSKENFETFFRVLSLLSQSKDPFHDLKAHLISLKESV
ncbi:MAG: aminopeptidase [Myxococcales bacterium]|nr:aminopeptidase [Myxococcales bacterium]USN51500.1 MAG: aminopeptidase [Myxococcales bacterium]